MASKPKKRKFKGESSRVLQRSGSHCEETVVEMKQVPPRVLVCQHDEVTKPISTDEMDADIHRFIVSLGTRRPAWRRSQGCDCMARELK